MYVCVRVPLPGPQVPGTPGGRVPLFPPFFLIDGTNWVIGELIAEEADK